MMSEAPNEVSLRAVLEFTLAGHLMVFLMYASLLGTAGRELDSGLCARPSDALMGLDAQYEQRTCRRLGD